MRKITQDELSNYIGPAKYSFDSTCLAKEKYIKKNLSNLDLSGLDFREMDLVGANFCHSNVSDCIFNYADLSGANFFGADLSGSDMSRSYIMGSLFHNADLSHVNLTDTCLDTSSIDHHTNVFRAKFDLTFVPILCGNGSKRYFKYAFYTIPIGNYKDVHNWYWTIYSKDETPLTSISMINDDFLLKIILRHINSVHNSKCLYVNHFNFKTIFEPKILKNNNGLN